MGKMSKLLCRRIIYAPNASFLRFSVRRLLNCSTWKPKLFIGDWARKSRPNFRLFAPCIIRIGEWWVTCVELTTTAAATTRICWPLNARHLKSFNVYVGTFKNHQPENGFVADRPNGTIKKVSIWRRNKVVLAAGIQVTTTTTGLNLPEFAIWPAQHERCW